MLLSGDVLPLGGAVRRSHRELRQIAGEYDAKARGLQSPSPDPTSDGKAGTVEKVRLDELHGLRVTITGHEGDWPISTLKFADDK
jgi:hypothetical protein